MPPPTFHYWTTPAHTCRCHLAIWQAKPLATWLFLAAATKSRRFNTAARYLAIRIWQYLPPFSGDTATNWGVENSAKIKKYTFFFLYSDFAYSTAQRQRTEHFACWMKTIFKLQSVRKAERRNCHSLFK